MSLSCERAGLGPNGPLDAAERAQWLRYAWHPPADRTPPVYIRQSVFATRTGQRSYAEFVDSTSPMQIDSEAPQKPLKDPNDSDIEMEDAPASPPPRRVQFSPPADYSRPSSSNSAVGPTTAALRSALAQKRDRINQTREYAPYVPKTPHRFNYDVDYSLGSVASDISKLSSRPSPLKPVGLAKELIEEAESETLLDIKYGLFRKDRKHPLFSPSIPRAKRELLASSLAQPQLAPKRKASDSLEQNTFEQAKVSPQVRKLISPKPQHTSPARRLEAHELYPNLQNQTGPTYQKQEQEQQQELGQDTVGRRIGGMVVSLVRFIPGIFAQIWNFFGKKSYTYKQEIVAVETSPTSGKRRAVAAEDARSQPSSKLPGYYPELDETMDKTTPPAPSIYKAATMTTPPDSRPTSAQSNHTPPEEAPAARTASKATPPEDEPARPAQEARSTQVPQQHHNETHVREQSQPFQAASIQDPPICRRPDSNYPRFTYNFNHAKPIPRPARPVRQPRTIDDPIVLPPEIRALYKKRVEREAAEREKESTVDNLIARSKQATIESPEQQLARLTISTQKKRRAEEAAAKRAAEEAKIAKEEARVRAEQEAKEAEEFRKKAEEEARVKAEEEARLAAGKAASKKEIVPGLSEVWQNKINKAMATTAPGHVVANSTRKVPITRKDIGCILPQQNEHSMRTVSDKVKGPASWLNDEGINAFIGAIVDRKNELSGWKGKADKKSPSYANYDCSWYTTYKKNNDINSLKRWSRRQGITGEKLLDTEKIFFPFNTGAHWMLLIISPTARTIDVLDSMGGSTSGFYRIARAWLAMELGEKYVEGEWTHLNSRSVSQLNMNDCGVFTCINALAAGKGAEFGDVPNVKGMIPAREYIVAVIMDGGFGSDFEL